MPLFRKPTAAEYEEALRDKRTTPIDVLEEVFREDPLYRSLPTKEAIIRAKWAGLPILKWVYFELKVAFEKYENEHSEEAAKKEETPEFKVDPSMELYDKHQRPLHTLFGLKDK